MDGNRYEEQYVWRPDASTLNYIYSRKAKMRMMMMHANPGSYCTLKENISSKWALENLNGVAIGAPKNKNIHLKSVSKTFVQITKPLIIFLTAGVLTLCVAKYLLFEKLAVCQNFNSE